MNDLLKNPKYENERNVQFCLELLNSDPLCHVTCLVVRLLTSNLKQIGEKNDSLRSFAPVRPEPEQWACEQPAETEGRQT